MGVCRNERERGREGGREEGKEGGRERQERMEVSGNQWEWVGMNMMNG